MYRRTCLLLSLALALPLSACAEPAPPQAAHAAHAVAGEAAPPAEDAALPRMLVHKSPTCGCCSVWIEHMRAAGFEVETVDLDDLGEVKARLGVPYGKGSCHTAEIGGYFVEGHVPAEDVRRLLAERPRAKGLALPGMPLGSPGMETPDGRRQAFTVELVGDDGGTQPFAHHPAR